MNDVPEASSYYRKVVEGVGTLPEIKLYTRSFLAKLYVIQEQYGWTQLLLLGLSSVS
jgi:hypothetical protein